MRTKRPKFPLVMAGLSFLLTATGFILGLVDRPPSTWRLVLSILGIAFAALAMVIIDISTRPKQQQPKK